MGSDYLKEKARRERKGWRDGRSKIKQPRLDDRPIPNPERVVKFTGRPQCSLKVGDNLVLQPRNRKLLAYNGLANVAEASQVPSIVRRAVALSNGMATGRVSRVDRLTGLCEITVECPLVKAKDKAH